MRLHHDQRKVLKLIVGLTFNPPKMKKVQACAIVSDFQDVFSFNLQIKTMDIPLSTLHMLDFYAIIDLLTKYFLIWPYRMFVQL